MSKLIILDPGHGGSDPGAVGNGLKEKDLNLAISLATRDELKNYECTVKMTRTKDVYVSLAARAATGKGADLFVSEHNNGNKSSIRGFETYCYSGTLLAPTLNYRDILHGTVYPYLKSLGVPDGGKRRYNHYITRVPACPVVLMEYLYVTNSTDAALLKKTAVLKELGRLTAQGIAKALGLKKKVSASPSTLYRVQIGAFKEKANAEVYLGRAKKAGFTDAFIVTSGIAKPTSPAPEPSPAPKTEPKPAPKPAPAIKVGSRVKVKQDAKDYNGTKLASFVYARTYSVIQVSGDRVVIGQGKTVTAAVRLKDLTLV